MKHLLKQQFAQYNAVEMSASYEQQTRDIGSVSDRVNAKERFVRRVTATRTLDSLHFFVIQLPTDLCSKKCDELLRFQNVCPKFRYKTLKPINFTFCICLIRGDKTSTHIRFLILRLFSSFWSSIALHWQMCKVTESWLFDWIEMQSLFVAG